MDTLALVASTVVVMLAVHSLHRGVLVSRVLRGADPPPPDAGDEWPRVTVQLPLFNEREVVASLVDAVAALDWPPDRWEIQVLDDSTDDTLVLAEPALRRARDRGLTVHVLHRASRSGWKAGALAAGLEVATGEFIAVFDADFRPNPDFLRRLLPHFAETLVGMVQARWAHTNADASLLTRAQARLLDAHFGVEHRGRHRAGRWWNFNGTAGVWRREAIVSAGGWQGDTLSEDLDLSYRAQLAGWSFVYRDDVGVPAELPDTMAAFLQQQARWATGSIQVFRKLGGRILRADVPVVLRVEALHQLSANFAWIGALFLALILPLGAILGASAAPVVVPTFGFTLLAHAAFLVTDGRGRRRDVPLAMLLALGLAWSQAGAVARALVGPAPEFERTPKGGRRAPSTRATSRVPAEVVLALWQGVGVVTAFARGWYAQAVWLMLFAAAYGWVGGARLSGVVRRPVAAVRKLIRSRA